MSKRWVLAAAVLACALVGAGCGILDDEPLPRSLSDASRELYATADLRDELPPEAFDCLLEGVDPGRSVHEALSDATREEESEVSLEGYDAAVEVLTSCLEGPSSYHDWFIRGFEVLEVEIDASSADCFADRVLDLPDRRVIAELSLAGGDPVLTSSELDAVADIFTDCVPAGPFGQLWTSSSSLVADGFCLAGVSSDDSTRFAVWRAAFAGGSEEGLSPELLEALRPLIGCMQAHPTLAVLGLEELPGDPSECVVDGVEEDPALAEVVEGASGRDDVISAGVGDRLVDVLHRCTETEGLTELLFPAVGLPDDGEIGPCLESALRPRERRRLIDGLIGTGQDVDPSTASAVVACTPGSFFAAEMARGALDEMGDLDLEPAEVVERDCADRLQPPSAAPELLPEAAVAGDPAVSSEATAYLASLWRCIRLDSMMAAVLEQQSGVVISEATRSCFGPKLQDLFVDQFTAGEFDENEAVGAAVLACMTPEEIEAISG